MKFNYELVEAWPPLAWIAFIKGINKYCLVRHGSWVETKKSWFCEAVWDGDFSEGGFDKTDIAIGSGGRIRDGKIVFVSSGTTVDRVQFLNLDGTICVSNSLACLLYSTGANVDITYDKYYQDFLSIIRGIHKYKNTIRTDLGEVKIVYFHNIKWERDSISLVEKPNAKRHFGCFADYRDFLTATLRRLGSNMQDPGRSHLFRPLGTLSSGYDSPAVSVLGKIIGLNQVLCFETSRGGDISDNGKRIADKLNLQAIRVSRSAWREHELSEIPFLAMNASGEGLEYKSAEKHLSGRFLLTGFHGDKVWDKNVKDVTPNIVRGDPTGTGLGEYRLRTGFLHCPVPFFGVRQISDIARISRSPEIAHWDIQGKYTRPIPRRIVEEIGIPRDWFGIKKRATSVLLFLSSEGFLSEYSKKAFFDWLSSQEGEWVAKGKEPPLQCLGGEGYAKIINRSLQKTIYYITSNLIQNNFFNSFLPNKIVWKINAIKWKSDKKMGRENDVLFKWLFPWAIEQAKAHYAQENRGRPSEDV